MPGEPTKRQAGLMAAEAKTLVNTFIENWKELEKTYPLEMLLLMVIVELRTQPQLSDEELETTIRGLATTADAAIAACLRRATH